MRLYEYEAKNLFRLYKIPVPDGMVIDGHNLSRLDQVTYPAMLKAQVFLGSRGKAGFVQSAASRSDAEKKAKEILGMKHGVYTIYRILVERQVMISRELYIAATIDRLEHKPLIMISQNGGMAIEEIAKEYPNSILKYYFNPGDKLNHFQAVNISSDLNLRGDMLGPGAELIARLYELFLGLDCKLVEINPLVLTEDKRLIAVDAKVDLDEDAMFRHPELGEMGISPRHEVGELTEREKIAKSAGIPYVDLDGDIGVFPGGAGFGIAAIDLVDHYGGKAANFMDSGGAPTQEKLRVMLGLLNDNPGVKVIFGARFGGISRCDDWAKALVQYVVERKPKKPMIMRMAGNMEEEARKILDQAKQDHPELFKEIKVYAYDTPIEEVIKETVRIAKTIK